MFEDIASLPWEDFLPLSTLPRQSIKRTAEPSRRTLSVSSEPKELFPQFSFPSPTQVFRLERQTSKLGWKPIHHGSGLRSHQPLSRKGLPGRLLFLVRNHWGIEAHHWIRDAVFGEDKSAARKGSAPGCMTIRRNLAIALLRLSGRDQIAGSLRFFSWKPSRAVSFLGV
ncbi:MAG: hypothetical protein ACYDBP_13625 [Leptospirales bacterium]